MPCIQLWKQSPNVTRTAETGSCGAIFQPLENGGGAGAVAQGGGGPSTVSASPRFLKSVPPLTLLPCPVAPATGGLFSSPHYLCGHHWLLSTPQSLASEMLPVSSLRFPGPFTLGDVTRLCIPLSLSTVTQMAGF